MLDRRRHLLEAVSNASVAVPRGRQSKPEVLVLGASILTVGLAAAQISGQDLIATGVLLASLPFVLGSPRARILVLTFGGLLAFQSSSGVSLLKSTYLGVAFIALLAAIIRLIDLPDRRAIGLMKPMVVTSSVFAGVVVLSLAVAMGEGTLFSDWLRDAAPYFLFSTVPIFALDLSTGVSRRYLVSVLIAVGVLAALSWAIEWAGSDRRNYFQLPISHLLLPSSLLAAALVCFSASRAITTGGRARIRWVGLSGALIAVLALLTGTRSELVLLVVPLLVSLALPGQVVARALRVMVFTIVALGVALAVTFLVLQIMGSSPQVLVDRFGTLPQILIDPTQDASYRLRQVQVESAFAMFLSSPIIGVGPGHLFDWSGVGNGTVLSTFNVDTGMELPAKFGLLGVAALVAISGALFVVLKRLAVTIRGEASRAALVAFAMLGAISFVLGSTLEDKGFSFGLILLLALALVDYQAPVSAIETKIQAALRPRHSSVRR
jgi:O-antigen ligase